MKSTKRTKALIEGAMMVALATVLSIFKIIDMPYGGSVTVASMLPIIILAYRHGVVAGLGGGAVFAAVQQLLGLNNLSYVSTWQSVLAIILLDYIFAFTVVGLGGIFRDTIKKQSLSLMAGAILVSLIRYIFHIISGATVWAGISIPTAAALIYSIGYNATYMIPECIVLSSVAYYLGGLIDFKKAIPERITADKSSAKAGGLLALSGGVFLVGIVTDITLIAPYLQDADTGAFTLDRLAEIDLVSLLVVTGITVALGITLFILAKQKSEEKVTDNSEE